MIVRFGENSYDIIKGIIAPGKSFDLPFNAGVKLHKKIKPHSKVKKKTAGDIWISSQKMSLVYLLVNYMFKHKYEKLAGFYPYDNNQHLLIEIILGANNAVNATFSIINESPEAYMEIEGKYYDAIFGLSLLHIKSATGNSKETLKVIDIPLEKLLKELSGMKLSNKHMVLAVGAVISVVFLVFTLKYVGIGAKKPPPAVAVKKVVEIKVLSGEEVAKLKGLTLAGLLSQYKTIAENLPDDRAFNTVNFNIAATGQEVTGSLGISYISYYPFPGSTKTENSYIWEETTSPLKFGKNELEKDMKGSMSCLAEIVDSKVTNTIGRTETHWKFSVNATDYTEAVSVLNLLYNCPVEAESFVLAKGKLTGQISIIQ